MGRLETHWKEKHKFPELVGLVDQLKEIPHLHLKASVPIKEIQSEVSQIKAWSPYELELDRPFKERLDFAKNWQGRGIIDWTRDSRQSMRQTRMFEGDQRRELDKNGEWIMHVTDLGKTMPATIDFIYSLCTQPYRCRITRVPSGGRIPWHSHCQFKSGRYPDVDYFLMTIQVPIFSNKNCGWGVSRFPRINGNPEYWRNYQMGDAWLFNSWHEHSFKNEGLADRLSLVLYFPITDGRFSTLLKESMKHYDQTIHL